MKTNAQSEMKRILDHIRQALGQVPSAVEKLARVDPGMIHEHLRSQAYAMPSEAPALDDETRTLIYLAAALASSSQPCVRATIDKARIQRIPREKIMETVHIVRFAAASKVVSDAESVFEYLEQFDHQAGQ